MSNNKRRRTRETGNKIDIVVERDGASYVKREQRQHRFAFELINVSRYHVDEARRAGRDNYWRRRANVISTIGASYAALEAAYNEFVHVTALSESSPLADEKREVVHCIANEDLAPQPKKHTLQRFNMLLRILEVDELPPDSEPYQSANLVRQLRNMLVHPVPSTVVTFDATDADLSSQQDIVKRLRSKLNLAHTATFPHDVLTPHCAAWASRSVEKFLQAFEARSRVDFGFRLQTG